VQASACCSHNSMRASSLRTPVTRAPHDPERGSWPPAGNCMSLTASIACFAPSYKQPATPSSPHQAPWPSLCVHRQPCGQPRVHPAADHVGWQSGQLQVGAGASPGPRSLSGCRGRRCPGHLLNPGACMLPGAACHWWTGGTRHAGCRGARLVCTSWPARPSGPLTTAYAWHARAEADTTTESKNLEVMRKFSEQYAKRCAAIPRRPMRRCRPRTCVLPRACTAAHHSPHCCSSAPSIRTMDQHHGQPEARPGQPGHGRQRTRVVAGLRPRRPCGLAWPGHPPHPPPSPALPRHMACSGTWHTPAAPIHPLLAGAAPTSVSTRA
jgi:hypothetical protein